MCDKHEIRIVRNFALAFLWNFGVFKPGINVDNSFLSLVFGIRESNSEASMAKPLDV